MVWHRIFDGTILLGPKTCDASTQRYVILCSIGPTWDSTFDNGQKPYFASLRWTIVGIGCFLDWEKSSLVPLWFPMHHNQVGG